MYADPVVPGWTKIETSIVVQIEVVFGTKNFAEFLVDGCNTEHSPERRIDIARAARVAVHENGLSGSREVGNATASSNTTAIRAHSVLRRILISWEVIGFESVFNLRVEAFHASRCQRQLARSNPR